MNTSDDVKTIDARLTHRLVAYGEVLAEQEARDARG